MDVTFACMGVELECLKSESWKVVSRQPRRIAESACVLHEEPPQP